MKFRAGLLAFIGFCIFWILIFPLILPIGQIENNDPGTRTGFIVLLIFSFFIVGIMLEWAIGKAIGRRITKNTGIILGIIFIILFPLFLMGIVIIIYSNKNEPPINVSVNLNLDSNTRNITPKRDINFITVNNQNEKINSSKKELLLNTINIDFIDILQKNNLGEYSNLFYKNNLNDYNILVDLTETDLEKLGIEIMGDRKKILKIINGATKL